jgi:hypothetical protein
VRRARFIPCRRLSAIGKMHRFNDLAWNAAHRAIQEPLQGALRPPPSARHRRRHCHWQYASAAGHVRCECARPARPRAAAFGFAGALRRGKTSPVGQGRRSACRSRHIETCPVRAFEAWRG